jgi:hypothetical protein
VYDWGRGIWSRSPTHLVSRYFASGCWSYHWRVLMMTRQETSFALKATTERADLACREAILALGWMIPELGKYRMRTRQPNVPGFTAWAEVEICLTETGGETVCTLHGKQPWSMFPSSKKQLSGKMNQLENAIVLAARSMR